jgi:hypothetical protein
MLDLNTLIAPGSGWQLTRALNINDQGEILAAADPLGVTPVDDNDLGRLVLLVPCEADDTGCDGNAAATISVAPQSSAQIANNLATRTPRTPHETVAAWRARLARQYHIPGTPKN